MRHLWPVLLGLASILMPRRTARRKKSPEGADVSYSADADARWVKKGGKSLLGYKAFAPLGRGRFYRPCARHVRQQGRKS